MLRALTILNAASFLLGCGSQFNQAFAQNQPAAVGPVVVELFTSQGCSSCPPADQLLAEISKLHEEHGFPVYCLSFHVDYWNSLGWKDPYSDKLYTTRQRNYATAFNSRSVYTPQMIVNGSTEFVGSRGGDATEAIKAALANSATSEIKLMAKLSDDKSTSEIEYSVSANDTRDVLNFALVQNNATNKVPNGENAGRSLTHVKVVRAFETVPLAQANSGKLSIKIPPSVDVQKTSIVAYVQNPRSMKITGAVVASF